MTEQKSSLLTGLVRYNKRRGWTIPVTAPTITSTYSSSAEHRQATQKTTATASKLQVQKLGNITRADGTATLVVWPLKIRQTRVKVLAFQLPYSITEHQYNNEQVQVFLFCWGYDYRVQTAWCMNIIRLFWHFRFLFQKKRTGWER